MRREAIKMRCGCTVDVAYIVGKPKGSKKPKHVPMDVHYSRNPFCRTDHKSVRDFIHKVRSYQ